MIRLAMAGLAAVACLAAPPQEKGAGRMVTDAAGARAAFEAAWKGPIRAAIEPQAWSSHDRLVQRGPTGSGEQACRTLRAGVLRMAGPEHEGLAVYGHLDRLDRAGQCWHLVFDGRRYSGLAAAIAPDGEVLLVWVLPEG
jgi:hypothetical protein